MGKEAIERISGIVDIRLSIFPSNRGLVAEIVGVVWVSGRGKGYRGV